MIVLFTDFGMEGPYLGQVMAAIYRIHPESRIINLFANAPSCEPQLAAYLLSAYVAEFGLGTIFLCVVDPGVGSERRPIVLEADGQFFVGPDNGLMTVVAKRAQNVQVKEISWRPEKLSETFHGRDLFAPVVAYLSRGEEVLGAPMKLEELVGADWPDELAKVIYVDGYGNLMTGIRASTISQKATIRVEGMEITWALRFSIVQKGDCFWYENSNGLVEVAVREGNAAKLLQLGVGDEITITVPGKRDGEMGRTTFE